ncbi:hypothetical protein [Chondromyces apiculatus]|uniref:PEGA domain-containing protein n=1 Tax=Chondromyces apiculatus DSM 436 TaxID=1192034 RepID=A0A017TGC2_9BACT|nr:hypothetical protein [Chondromyces apiculatus]EYF07962.1 Hypothetical protein CAP_6984 [Chondromyces apiculatus DSM 436]
MSLPRRRPTIVAILVLSLATASTSGAMAQQPAVRAPSPADKALAEALFLDGRKRMDAGEIAEACPKFAESHRLDPSAGTLLNLAVCHAKEGRTASAWVEFKEAAALSEAAGKPDRAVYGRKRAAELEAELSRLQITVTATLPGMVLRLDGATLSAVAAVGTGMPVDPGEHTLEGVAPGKKTWSERVMIAPGPATKVVVVPALEDEPAVALPVPSETARGPTASGPQGQAGRAGGATSRGGASGAGTGVAGRGDASGKGDARGRGGAGQGGGAQGSGGSGGSEGSGDERAGTLRTLGFVAGGVGVVGLGLGAAFGLVTFGHASEASKACNPGDVACGAERQEAYDSGKITGVVSTVAFGAGVAGLGAGLALLLLSRPTAPAARKGRLWVTPEIGPGGTQVTVGGLW